jgi:A/G-specific adenine glycosylase
MSIFFKNTLLKWHDPLERDLPWKTTNDPYKIWLSEVILQQTRVDQGRPYYLKFVENYPNVKSLSVAPLSEVLRLWQGLGYYARARNMHLASKQVMNQFNGVFPSSYNDLLKIKGIGPYTAAAISSFSIKEPRAVIDGNVYRVLARFFNINVPIDTKEGKLIFNNLANDCLDRNQPDQYNQAIMDFGALVCTPKKPNCERCPLQNNCISFYEKTISELPIKSKKIIKRERFFLYQIVKREDYVAIQKRVEKDIWQELFEFPIIEFKSQTELFKSPLITKDSDKVVTLKQTLTHQIIHGFFVFCGTKLQEDDNKGEVLWINSSEISKFAFPKIICQFLEGNYF